MRGGGERAGDKSEMCETQVVNLWMRETRLPMLYRKQQDELLLHHALKIGQPIPLADIKTLLMTPQLPTYKN